MLLCSDSASKCLCFFFFSFLIDRRVQRQKTGQWRICAVVRYIVICFIHKCVCYLKTQPYYYNYYLNKIACIESFAICAQYACPSSITTQSYTHIMYNNDSALYAFRMHAFVSFPLNYFAYRISDKRTILVEQEPGERRTFYIWSINGSVQLGLRRYFKFSSHIMIELCICVI